MGVNIETALETPIMSIHWKVKLLVESGILQESAPFTGREKNKSGGCDNDKI